MTESTGSQTDSAGADSSAVQLAPPDHTYLQMETKGRPMHWAMLLTLDDAGPPLQLDAVRARVRQRSTLFDIYRMGVRHGRWRSPEVVLAQHWDAGAQVTQMSFGDQQQLHSAVSTLLATPLPRPDPFWQMTVLTPDGTVEGQRHQVLLRVHHSLSDGLAGAAFAALLADGDAADLAEFERFATSPRFRISGIDDETLRSAKAGFAQQHLAGGKRRHWPSLTRSGRRDYALHRASTRALRRAARQHGAGVHEYLIAAIGRTISVLPPPTGSARAEVLRVTLPVTLDDEFRHTGNAVSVALLNLAGNQPDLGGQLTRVRTELDTIARLRPELALAAADDVPRAPWPIQRALVAASMARMHPDIHIGINPGFSRVRSVLGHRITTLTPLSPLAGYSFSVTALVLGDTTTFGIVTDPDALPGYAGAFAERFGRVLDETAPQHGT